MGEPTQAAAAPDSGSFRAMADDFKPGLEGVVAVETEIAEPDREGGSLRYRGIDIEELVGRYPYENVWDCSSTTTSTRRCRIPSPTNRRA